MTTMTWTIPPGTLTWTDGQLSFTILVPEMRKAITDEIDRMIHDEATVEIAPMATVYAGLDDPLEAWATIRDVLRRWHPDAINPPIPPVETGPLSVDPRRLRF